jgi:hypothetical protein
MENNALESLCPSTDHLINTIKQVEEVKEK